MKVAVLVYEGDLSVGGWAALVQSYLHHLQLHVNTHGNKGGVQGRGASDGAMTKKKSKGKRVSGSKHDPTDSLPNVFRQCGRKREKVWG